MTQELSPVLTVDALAQMLGLSRAKTYAEIKANRIPHIRLQKRIIISRSAILSWLQQSGRNESARVGRAA